MPTSANVRCHAVIDVGSTTWRRRSASGASGRGGTLHVTVFGDPDNVGVRPEPCASTALTTTVCGSSSRSDNGTPNAKPWSHEPITEQRSLRVRFARVVNVRAFALPRAPSNEMRTSTGAVGVSGSCAQPAIASHAASSKAPVGGVFGQSGDAEDAVCTMAKWSAT